MITIVLGMHKSGTTLISQILHHSGISMGEHFDEGVSYDKGNKYEREAVLGLNMSILGKDDYQVIDVEAAHGMDMTLEQRELMRGLIRDCDARHQDWGFKDPRTSLTYPLWADELPPHRIIAVYRDPMEVWPHFKWMGRRGYATNFRHAYVYLKRWAEHNDGIREIFRTTTQETLMLGYRELMTTDAEFQRLVDFVGQDLDDRRRPDLYRNKGKQDVFIRFGRRLFERRFDRTLDGMMAELDALRR